MTEYTFRMHFNPSDFDGDGTSAIARDGVETLREVKLEVPALFAAFPFCEYIMILKNGKPLRCVIR